ncbi:unnamed protein product [Nippostrongylus brasiliensis]|uniref:Photolyase/cryptochrome alpha/beta domain-containing protein n=1 Tax=Nippostrongylus brasiliensis TaxID=27835 RepID=A0A0N4Y274_NIPBR|nr:unnamed protein product [Nippostrongylus brasiliensis]
MEVQSNIIDNLNMEKVAPYQLNRGIAALFPKPSAVALWLTLRQLAEPRELAKILKSYSVYVCRICLPRCVEVRQTARELNIEVTMNEIGEATEGRNDDCSLPYNGCLSFRYIAIPARADELS